MCEQSLGKVWIYSNEYCMSYRLHKLGTPEAFQMKKVSKFNTPQKWKKNYETCKKIEGAHLQYV